MQQPLEDRVTSLEAAAARHEQHMARLDAIIEHHDEMLERLLALEEELARDAAVTRRLWLRLAQRYGWLDDETNGAQPDTPA